MFIKVRSYRFYGNAVNLDSVPIYQEWLKAKDRREK